MSAFDCTRFRDVASSIDGDSSMSSRDTGISTYKWARATCLPVMAQWRPLGAFCFHQHPHRPPRCHMVRQGHTHTALGLDKGQRGGNGKKRLKMAQFPHIQHARRRALGRQTQMHLTRKVLGVRSCPSNPTEPPLWPSNRAQKQRNPRRRILS